MGALPNNEYLDIHVYESASVIAEVGAGIALWPRVWETVKALGLDKSLLQFASQPPDKAAREHSICYPLITMMLKSVNLQYIGKHKVSEIYGVFESI